jgi:hypothetical protein
MSEWECPREGCDRNAAQHTLAEALEHIDPELTAEDSIQIAQRTIDKTRLAIDDIAQTAAAIFGVDPAATRAAAEQILQEMQERDQ